MDSNAVAIAVCAVPPVTPIPPTLGKAFSPATIDASGVSTLTITLSNADATAASLTAPLGGSYFNSLAAGALQTSNGNTAAPAVATLTVKTK
jgi:hypothetical protein